MDKNTPWRLKVCHMVKCEHLKGADCTAKECIYPDPAKAEEELRAKVVKHG